MIAFKVEFCGVTEQTGLAECGPRVGNSGFLGKFSKILMTPAVIPEIMSREL